MEHPKGDDLSNNFRPASIACVVFAFGVMSPRKLRKENVVPTLLATAAAATALSSVSIVSNTVNALL